MSAPAQQLATALPTLRTERPDLEREIAQLEPNIPADVIAQHLFSALLLVGARNALAQQPHSAGGLDRCNERLREVWSKWDALVRTYGVKHGNA